jgi:hypothetical protein
VRLERMANSLSKSFNIIACSSKGTNP